MSESDIALAETLDDIDPDAMSLAEMDTLSFGLIGVDQTGRITHYNETESRISGRPKHAVLGRNLFTEVALCTNHPDFFGRFKAGVRRGRLRENFIYIYDYDMRPMRAQILMREGSQKGQYWIGVTPIEYLMPDRPDMANQAMAFKSKSGAAAPSVCEPDPIHRPGLIQPHGALIGIDPETAWIVAASANLGDITGLSAEAALGGPATALLPEAPLEQILTLPKEWRPENPSPLDLVFKNAVDGRSMAGHASMSGNIILLDMETAPDPAVFRTIAIEEMRAVTEKLRRAQSMTDMCGRAAQAARTLSGFERTFIYRFDEDGSGLAIAEDKAEDWLESFQGLRFPSSEISSQARRLYQRSLFRMVPTRDYAPTPVKTVPGRTPEPLDLSYSTLRSISPIHLEYHRDIGVNGSASFSILHGGLLWGLLICHSRMPHHLTVPQRTALLLLAERIGILIGEIEHQETNKKRSHNAHVYAQILKRCAGTANLEEALVAGAPTLADLFDCSGAAFVDGESVHRVGSAPPDPMIHDLVDQVRSKTDQKLYHSRATSSDLSALRAQKAVASGVLIAFIGDGRESALVWFFPEKSRRVDWAGNPNKPIDAAGDGDSLLLPRKSFERWTQITEGVAERFDDWMIEQASNLRQALSDVVAQKNRCLRELNRELLRNENRLQAILDTAAEAIITVDPRGMILSVNPATETIFGYGRDVLLGQPLSTIVADMTEMVQMQLTARGFRIAPHIIETVREVTGRRKSGETFAAELSFGRWHHDGEDHFSAVLRDISDRKKTEERLRQSQKMEAVGQLTGGIAHDFNNLLAIIKSNLELLAEDEMLDRKRRQRVREALLASERGSRLTKRLLAFARRQPLAPDHCGPNDLIENVVPLFKRTLPEGIALELDLDPAVPSVFADEAQLEAALLNLVINARDAMPEVGILTLGTRAVTLRIEDIEPGSPLQPGHYAAIEVIDSGTGMAPDILDKVFEPFFTTKGPGSGTGLGLSVVLGFVRQSSGDVRLDSRLGEGTRISLLLPERKRPSHPKPRVKAIGADAAEGQKVLLVEDEEAVRGTVASMLHRLGYSVISAADPTQALERLDENPDAALMLSDVVLGAELDGFALTREACARHPNLRVVLMSGYAGEELERRDETKRPILAKPFSLAELAGTLRDVWHEA